MNRNLLYLIIGALGVATAVLGYQYYQHQQKPTGIEIDVGKAAFPSRRSNSAEMALLMGRYLESAHQEA